LWQSLSFFQTAIERDPSLARAYAGIAWCYIQMGTSGLIPWSDALARGKTAVKRALEISPDLAEAHCLLSELFFMADDPLPAQEMEARRGLELNPNIADAYVVLGSIEAQKGNLGSYVANSEMAYQLDPLSPRTIRRLGLAYFYAGRDQEALEHWRKTLHLSPVDSYRQMADYYASKGDLEKAEEMTNNLERIAPNNEFTHLSRGYIAALKGDRAQAMEMIAKLDATHEQGYVRSIFAGYIYLKLGDVDRFFEYMAFSTKGHYLPATDLMYSPDFLKVRGDPRFKQLLNSVGLDLPPQQKA